MYGNPYYQPRFQSNTNQIAQNPYMQPMQQPISTLQSISNQINLLGKVVGSIEVVKAMDIPLDGSTSYFPLMDGSAIVTKQLQMDGTSKTKIYKPIQEDKKEMIQFATLEDIQNAINELDLSDVKDLKKDIDDIKKELKEYKNKQSKEK